MNEYTGNHSPRPGVSITMLMAGILLVGFSAGRWLAPLAAWIGPALIMRYARDYRSRSGYLLLLIGYIAAFLIGFVTIWVSGFGVGLTTVLAIGYGFLWTLPYLADRWMVRRLPGFSGTLVYPLAATTLEFVNIQTNPVGMWGATGFTQYGNLQLMQLASVTGMIGITFLMGWFASVANWAWENRGRSREVLPGLAAFGAVLVVVLAFGFVRLNLASISENEETVRIAGITAVSMRGINDFLAYDLQSHRDAYFGETVREAQAGAAVIVWPEGAGLGPISAEASLIGRAQEVARQYGIYLTIPLFTYPDDLDSGQLPVNKLLLIDPAGETVLEHVKYGGDIFENRIQGDGKLQTAATPFGVLSGVICYDADYPRVIQQSGRNGTGLMLVPSNDWPEIDPIHSQMAVFRAIENGMSLVRQTDSGLSIAVDPYGRTLAQADFFGATDRTLVAQVPVRHVTTIYTLFGRWFEWLAPFGLMFLIVSLLIPRRRKR
jgi:apolipoprotein N-acyltransferase